MARIVLSLFLELETDGGTIATDAVRAEAITHLRMLLSVFRHESLIENDGEVFIRRIRAAKVHPDTFPED